MSESNKSKCLECGRVYRWSGFKTGIGKSPEQILQMVKDDHTCKYCGSKELVTGLDWTGSQYEANHRDEDPEYRDFSVLTKYEIQRTQTDFKSIDASKYCCRHCQSNDLVVISKWEDTDGKFILLYCEHCKKRSASVRYNPDEYADWELPVIKRVYPANVTKSSIDAGSTTPIKPSQPTDEPPSTDEALPFISPPAAPHRISMTERHSAPNVVMHEYDFTAMSPVINGDLIHVDPYDPNLDEETMNMILKECRMNFWYFVQNIMKVDTIHLDTQYITNIQRLMDAQCRNCERDCGKECTIMRSPPKYDPMSILLQQKADRPLVRKCIRICLDCSLTGSWEGIISDNIFRDHGECSYCGSRETVIVECATNRRVTIQNIDTFNKGGSTVEKTD